MNHCVPSLNSLRTSWGGRRNPGGSQSCVYNSCLFRGIHLHVGGSSREGLMSVLRFYPPLILHGMSIRCLVTSGSIKFVLQHNTFLQTHRQQCFAPGLVLALKAVAEQGQTWGGFENRPGPPSRWPARPLSRRCSGRPSRAQLTCLCPRHPVPGFGLEGLVALTLTLATGQSPARAPGRPFPSTRMSPSCSEARCQGCSFPEGQRPRDPRSRGGALRPSVSRRRGWRPPGEAASRGPVTRWCGRRRVRARPKSTGSGWSRARAPRSRRPRGSNSVPVAPVTERHSLDGFKGTNIYLSHSEARSLRSKCWQGWFLLETLGKSRIQTLPAASGGCPRSLVSLGLYARRSSHCFSSAARALLRVLQGHSHGV